MVWYLMFQNWNRWNGSCTILCEYTQWDPPLNILHLCVLWSRCCTLLIHTWICHISMCNHTPTYIHKCVLAKKDACLLVQFRLPSLFLYFLFIYDKKKSSEKPTLYAVLLFYLHTYGLKMSLSHILHFVVQEQHWCVYANYIAAYAELCSNTRSNMSKFKFQNKVCVL